MSEQTPNQLLHPPVQEMQEHRHQSQLVGELREYRAEMKFEETTRVAKQIVEYAGGGVEREMDAMFRESSHEDPVLEAAQHGTVRMATPLNSPNSRRLLGLAASAVGKEPDGFLKEITKQEQGTQLTVAIGQGVGLEINAVTPRSGDVEARIAVDSSVPLEVRQATLEAFSSKLKEMQAAKDASEEINAMLDAGSTEAYASTVLKFSDNPDDIAAYISYSTLRGTIQSPWEDTKLARARQQAIEAVYDLPYHYPGETEVGKQAGMYFDENGKLLKVLLPTGKPGLYLGLKSANPESSADLSELPLQLGVEIDAEQVYGEPDYNQRIHEGVTPFIETEAAQELLSAFEHVGLTPTKHIRDTFAEVAGLEKRYGHGYAELTREIAKCVNNRDRSLKTIFESEGDDVAQKILQLGPANDPAAKVVHDLLVDVVDRKQPDGTITELPMSAHEIRIRDGSCKDAEYYVSDGGVINDEAGEPLFVRSTYHRPSVMTMRPTLLNGVRLPAGSLLAVEDDGYVFMRILSFAFNENEALHVFGAQEAENRMNSQHTGLHDKLQSPAA